MSRRPAIAAALAVWAACVLACSAPKSKEEKAAEVAQQAKDEGWEAALAHTQSQAAEKFPDPDLPPGTSEGRRRVAIAEVAVRRARWVADWYGGKDLPPLDLSNLHVGAKGHLDAGAVVETVHGRSLVVVVPAGRGVARFAVGGVQTADRATGEKVHLLGNYEAAATDDYGTRTLIVLFPMTPDAKDTWKHEQAIGLLWKAEEELKTARAAIERPAPSEAKPAAEAKTPADPKPAVARLAARQAAYVQVVAALDRVEAAAVQKFGRKPRADDLAGFAIPYKVFVERETGKALDSLAEELRLSRSELDGIRRDGDAEGWPKK
jgi:hypothetical protein